VTDLTTSTGLESDLTATGARFSPVELRLPDTISKSDWAQIGQKLLRADQVMQWWIGDWAAFGAGDETKEGWRKRGALAEFCRMNPNLDYGNVRNKAWVSSSVHLSLRRTSLPWSYFQEIAPLKPRDQKIWIERAASESLTVADLRKRIRLDGGEGNALVSDGPIIEFGTEYFDCLKAWLLKRPPEFWTLETKDIWEGRTLELARIVGKKTVTTS